MEREVIDAAVYCYIKPDMNAAFLLFEGGGCRRHDQSVFIHQGERFY